jgi:hypothetical protein
MIMAAMRIMSHDFGGLMYEAASNAAIAPPPIMAIAIQKCSPIGIWHLT